MANNVGGFLGTLVAFMAWKAIGGVGGFLVAVFLVAPVASAVFIGVLSAMGGGGDVIESPGLVSAAPEETAGREE